MEESKYLGVEDKRILTELRASRESFGASKRSIFTESMLRRVARGWAANVNEVDGEARRLFGAHYAALRFEDLLENPEREMRRIWRFLGVRSVPASLDRRIRQEMKSNPDEEWQSKRDRGLAPLLGKGRTGNWRDMLTARDREIFEEIAGEVLQHWKYPPSRDF